MAKIHVPFCTLKFLPQDINFYPSKIFRLYSPLLEGVLFLLVTARNEMTKQSISGLPRAYALAMTGEKNARND